MNMTTDAGTKTRNRDTSTAPRLGAGGSLRVYSTSTRNSSSGRYRDIRPIADRIVLFRSQDVRHEVLPVEDSAKNSSVKNSEFRFALTCWIEFA